MKTTTDRILMAYRPLALRGMLVEGQVHPPRLAAGAPPARARRLRALLAALTHAFTQSGNAR